MGRRERFRSRRSRPLAADRRRNSGAYRTNTSYVSIARNSDAAAHRQNRGEARSSPLWKSSTLVNRNVAPRLNQSGKAWNGLKEWPVSRSPAASRVASAPALQLRDHSETMRKKVANTESELRIRKAFATSREPTRNGSCASGYTNRW